MNVDCVWICLQCKSWLCLHNSSYIDLKKKKKSFVFNQPPGTKIFIGNLPDDCDLDRLRSLFETAGSIAEFDVIKNYGFVVSNILDYYYY